MMHFWKMISTFHKNHQKKSTVMSLPQDSTPSMVELIVKPTNKRKHGKHTKDLAKQTRKA